MRDDLPPKLFFRIGEVAGLVGVEPHVLRYWEREFRSIRPTKSAKGQRVYSRKDVENLLRVRDLLYRDGFTIAGAKKKLQHGDDPTTTSLAKAQVQLQHEPESMPHAKLGSARERERGHHHEHTRDHDLAVPASQVSLSSEQDDEEAPESEHVVSVMQSAEAASAAIASASATATPPTPRVREKLVALRSEIESFLAELQPETREDALPRPRVDHHGKSES